jgi:hypothetical protein
LFNLSIFLAKFSFVKGSVISELYNNTTNPSFSVVVVSNFPPEPLTKIVYFFPSILTSVLGVPFESVLIGESGLMGIKILLFINS